MREFVDRLASPLRRASTKAVGVIALSLLLIAGTLPMAGCSGATVAQDIVNWTPSLQSAVATVDTTASLLAPVDAPIFTAATVGFDAASDLLVAQAKAYLANPSASILAQLQIQVTTLQQQVSASLLKALAIKDTASQQHALSVLGVVSTVVNAILALVQSISSKVAVAAMASASTIKLAQVRPLMDQVRTIEIVQAHYGETGSDVGFYAATARVDDAYRQLQSAGF
jgi:hypothetical protein